MRPMSFAMLVALILTSAAFPKPAGKDDPDKDEPFACRTGAARETLLRELGGTAQSEAAVARGLKWITSQQAPDGHWALDGAFKDKGAANDVAGTAFGLLPLLGAGHTHKASKTNPYDTQIKKGLEFLKRRQDAKKGDFGGGMYAHALASLAVCEAYGLTKDPAIRPVAQKAVNFIVTAQHATNGGWRYAPGQEGDTSVTAWEVQVLKSAQLARLDVPDITIKRAILYLNNSMNPMDNGYGYVGIQSTPSMSAAGLLCRQTLQGWGPNKQEVVGCVKNHVLPQMPAGANPPKHAYLYYYATLAMRNYGGDNWKTWNQAMRDSLVKTQHPLDKSADAGSWSSAGDQQGQAGGRLMITSLNLLTLEVYYRYPLAGRPAKE